MKTSDSKIEPNEEPESTAHTCFLLFFCLVVSPARFFSSFSSLPVAYAIKISTCKNTIFSYFVLATRTPYLILFVLSCLVLSWLVFLLSLSLSICVCVCVCVYLCFCHCFVFVRTKFKTNKSTYQNDPSS